MQKDRSVVKTSFFIILGLLVFGGIGVFWWPEDPDEAGDGVRKTPGCDRAAPCPPGQLCAKKGCFLLLPTENRELWREDIATQLDPKGYWKAVKPVGEPILPTERCELPVGQIAAPDETRMSFGAVLKVYLLGVGGLAVVHQIRAKSSYWTDALRFWIDRPIDLNANSLCASREIIRVSTGKAGAGDRAYVDVALQQSVPVGAWAQGAIRFKWPAARANNGADFVKSTIVLDAQQSPASAVRTALLLPLGASLISIAGAEPYEQQLLTNHVAYFWRHAEKRRELTVTYQFSGSFVQPSLDWSELAL